MDTTLLQEGPRWLAVHGDFCSSTCLPHSLPTLTTGCSVFGNEQNLELQLHPVINKLRKPNKYSCNSIVKNEIPSLFFYPTYCHFFFFSLSVWYFCQAQIHKIICKTYLLYKNECVFSLTLSVIPCLLAQLIHHSRPQVLFLQKQGSCIRVVVFSVFYVVESLQAVVCFVGYHETLTRKARLKIANQNFVTSQILSYVRF